MKHIDKKIVNTYLFLYKFLKSNKFKTKKINNFIYVYLLYIQNNYNLKFNFIDQTKEKTLYQCLKSLYKDFSEKKVKNLLFPKDPLLLEIFLHKEDFNPKKYIQKLTDSIYSNNYININIQIIDYLGNSSKDTAIINNCLCLIFFKELYPDFKIDKNLINHMVKSIVTMSNTMNNNIVKYTNTQAIFLLIQLKKISCIKDFDSWIQKLLDNQLNNGKWNNGFNSYFASNPELLDIVHTCVALIVLLEYQTMNQHKKILSNENNQTDDNKTNNNQTELIEKFDNKEKSIETFLNKKKKIIEKFDQINSKEKGDYYLNLNIYNISLTIITICLIIFFIKMNKNITILKKK